eukprot:TRINITY_DN67763_c0_g2_i7.p1 TRINITY_DN67763_c0_g2~~TRINITY_DN67763_c0_g2_i7.p1  ORF type:complete len:421 (-),score=64.99 TRINITY_DN67763_c0_g2_i7:117-1379(-)
MNRFTVLIMLVQHLALQLMHPKLDVMLFYRFLFEFGSRSAGLPPPCCDGRKRDNKNKGSSQHFRTTTAMMDRSPVTTTVVATTTTSQESNKNADKKNKKKIRARTRRNSKKNITTANQNTKTNTNTNTNPNTETDNPLERLKKEIQKKTEREAALVKKSIVEKGWEKYFPMQDIRLDPSPEDLRALVQVEESLDTPEMSARRAAIALERNEKLEELEQLSRAPLPPLENIRCTAHPPPCNQEDDHPDAHYFLSTDDSGSSDFLPVEGCHFCKYHPVAVHADLMCRKLQQGYNNKIWSSQAFSFWDDRHNEEDGLRIRSLFPVWEQLLEIHTRSDSSYARQKRWVAWKNIRDEALRILAEGHKAHGHSSSSKTVIEWTYHQTVDMTAEPGICAVKGQPLIGEHRIAVDAARVALYDPCQES